MDAAALIVGCGAQGRVAADILRLQYPGRKIFFIDDDKNLWGKKVNDIEVAGGIAERVRFGDNAEIHIALGNPFMREKIAKEMLDGSAKILSAIHPSAEIAWSAILGVGLMIGAGAIVNSNANVGNFCILNTRSIVEHDVELGEFGCISPGACVGGRVKIGKRSFISSGAIIRARVEIGQDSLVGMGAVVTKNVFDGEMVYGNPARKKGDLRSGFNWNNIL